jgi:hypothetical protein
VNLEGRAHGTLDVNHLDVLPSLLKKRDQEVHRKLDIKDNFVVSHTDVGDGKGQASHLLHLELDGSLDGINLVLKNVVLIKGGGELTSLVEARTKDTRDLLDQGGGGQEVIIFLGELLNKLLVLVELLQVLNGHLVNSHLVGLLAMLGISKDTHGGVRLGDGRKLESTGETLVSLGIVVLKGHLKLHGLGEVSLLALEGLLAGGLLSSRVLEDLFADIGKTLTESRVTLVI